jgi:sterol 3beta-glucosyltransferase
MDAVAKHMAEQAAMGGIQQDASRTGGGSLVLGSMVLKGGGGMRRTSESVQRE